ncbi:MAG: glycosyltransferase [Leptolyngbyaceae bacterium]|nr:glycosyltransferase [Leptolyngbyaceae bacterium]
MKLSFCMIVKNEEIALPNCLNSVKHVVDEIVVLDTGSTDRTTAIARDLGATVYNFQWCHDFSAARNECLKYAHGDWVLVLDADEILVPDVVPQLWQAMQSETHLVINLVRQEIGADQSPYSLISRLFRRHPDLYFSRPYHAMIDDSVALILEREPHWQIVHIPDVAILHEGYQPGAIAQHNKFARAKTTMEGFLALHPQDPYVCSKLGALYVAGGDLVRGVELLERGLKSPHADPPVLYELHYHLGIACTQLQQLSQAAKHYLTATEQPILPKLKLGAYNNLGSLLKDQGDLAGAQTAYQTTLEIDPSFAMGHYNLGMTLKTLGRLGDAIAHYHQAIALKPGYAEAYQNLGVALLKVGNLTESLGAFRQAIALHEQQRSPEAQRLRQGLKEMGLEI